MNNVFNEDTICALATPNGAGAIAVIRLSGPDSIHIADKIFKGNKPLSEHKARSIAFGNIVDFKTKEHIDEVLVSIFKAPHSYTGENSVEISCHGSSYIIKSILENLIDAGARNASTGEFTQRAYLNNKLDLAQAEAVADLISSETAAAHKMALNQMKGGFSNELSIMREGLLNLVSLMELELDFSEEDVEFADREQLSVLLNKVSIHIRTLRDSFKLGNVIKNGVPVAIVGATNTGKSTLLNALVGEDRAIVSDIHGTTRDTIEDTINLGGITFRFIDTAGIRNTSETIEMIGIERTYAKMALASILILMLDAQRPHTIAETLENFSLKLHETQKGDTEDRTVFILLNKIDSLTNSESDKTSILEDIKAQSQKLGLSPTALIPLSAKENQGLDTLKDSLTESYGELSLQPSTTLVSNIRHYEALSSAQESLERISYALNQNLPTDLLTQDIRDALYHIGSITGSISNDEILGNIFSKFCIGK